MDWKKSIMLVVQIWKHVSLCGKLNEIKMQKGAALKRRKQTQKQTKTCKIVPRNIYRVKVKNVLKSYPRRCHLVNLLISIWLSMKFPWRDWMDNSAIRACYDSVSVIHVKMTWLKSNPRIPELHVLELCLCICIASDRKVVMGHIENNTCKCFSNYWNL